MKSRKFFSIYLLVLAGVFFIIAFGCETDEEDVVLSEPELQTTAVTRITYTTAVSGGKIISDGGAAVTSRGVCWSISENPTIDDSKTTDGAGEGNFISNISGLSTNTYYLRAYAINSVGVGYGQQLCFVILDETNNTYTDSRDGTVYQTVTIDTVVWMAENLRFLPSVVGPETGSETIPYYYVYDYIGTNLDDAKATSTYQDYGVLYNWKAAKESCPAGWHVARNDEWTQLIDFFGGESVAGGKLKESSYNYWGYPNIGATNESGFTALPGGCRYSDGEFYNFGFVGFWWTGTESVSFENSAWHCYMTHAHINVGNGTYHKDGGFSVRCVRN